MFKEFCTKKFLVLTIGLIMVSVIRVHSAETQKVSLIPLPEKIEWKDGSFLLSSKTTVTSAEEKLRDYFTDYVAELTGIRIDAYTDKTTNNKILININ